MVTIKISLDEAVKDVFPSVKRGMKALKHGMKAVRREIRL